MPDVPPEALDVAIKAIRERTGAGMEPGSDQEKAARWHAVVALEAAAPILAEAWGVSESRPLILPSLLGLGDLSISTGFPPPFVRQEDAPPGHKPMWRQDSSCPMPWACDSCPEVHCDPAKHPCTCCRARAGSVQEAAVREKP